MILPVFRFYCQVQSPFLDGALCILKQTLLLLQFICPLPQLKLTLVQGLRIFKAELQGTGATVAHDITAIAMRVQGWKASKKGCMTETVTKEYDPLGPRIRT